MGDAILKVLAVILPELTRAIVRAIGGDTNARRRLADFMPGQSRSKLERAIDEAQIDAIAAGFPGEKEEPST